MVLESTMICVDNSDYMRNGDFVPTRLQAQQEAVSVVCHSKARANPENNVGLLTLAGSQVLAALTGDVGRVLAKLHRLQPQGTIDLLTGVRIAHLALKHRQGKNHKMRIVVFVGSPIKADEKELVKLAKRLKKEKVNVDVVSFGEDADNSAPLTAFVNALNGKDGGGAGGSHLVAVPAGGCVVLSEALISSPVVGGDGSGPSGSGMSQFEFGVDPNEDPELALALRVSMEEQRQRQEEESRRQQGERDAAAPDRESGAAGRALAMSLGQETMDLSEEEQIALAMEMSMQQETANEESMDVSEEYDEVIHDSAFLQSILANLPGVDPQSETIRNTITTLKNKDASKDEKEPKDKDKEGPAKDN